MSVHITMLASAEDDRWSAVPQDILGLILRRLTSTPDAIRFSAVCPAWHSTWLADKHLLSPVVPLLLLPCEDTDELELLDLNSNILHKLPARLNTHQKIIAGSSFGWLVTLEYSNSTAYDIQLLNPITRETIQLPPATAYEWYAREEADYGHASFDLQDYEVDANRIQAGGADRILAKAVLSSDPKSDPNCVVLAIHYPGNMMSFCRIGDTKWREFPHPTTLNRFFGDAIYHKGCFYAIARVTSWPGDFGIMRCEVGGPETKLDVLVLQPPRLGRENGLEYYLVSAEEGLLMVSLYWEKGEKVEDGRRVCVDRLDLETNTWEEVKSLDDRVLFVGGGSCIFISAQEMNGCKPNSIFFVDEYAGTDLDRDFLYGTGGCHLEDQETVPFYYKSYRFSSSRQFWLTPAL